MKRIRLSDRASAYLMIAPAVLLVVLLSLYLYGYAIWTSFQMMSPLLPPKFAGLKNYAAVITSIYFLRAVKNTLIFTAFTVPITVVLGVLTASLLNRRFWGGVGLKAMILLPWAIPTAISGVIWRGVFNDGWGALNASLYLMGLIPNYIRWLTTPNLAKFAVIVAQVWAQFPMAAVLTLAAIQAIPEELYESAAIDGAGVCQRFLYITLPNIKAMLAIVTVYEILMGLTTFDITYALTGGGPGTATILISYFTWAESFKMLNFGNGTALAVLLALTSLVLIVFGILRLVPTELILGGEGQ